MSITKLPETREYCFEEALKAEKLMIEMRRLGDKHAEAAFRIQRDTWLEEAVS